MFSVAKRIIDFSLSLTTLIVLSIVLLIVSLIIKFESPGPVFFKQRRIGKDKKEFEILKFRTMKIDAPNDMPTHMLDKPDSYITKIGKFLRKTSLDELPQLFNILKGEMSLIGPRPALWNQDDLIAERDKYKANDVLPGLTGLAQISGRDELPIEVKAKIDGEYVEKKSPGLELQIFLKTVFSVLKSDGVKEGKREVS
ncbi:sugar transferase [Planococcus liqunii]|uniref:sugar transferase n=1 Tax=Planococcus liqunii TaxID=3058394 RepID=UPI002618384B|nr:sugar transferase [Planococcus sp. N056]WKA50222.1 sugar transferase [Planococcus sp. N056]